MGPRTPFVWSAHVFRFGPHLAALAAVLLFGATPAAAQNVAFIDVQYILENSNAGRIARDLLKQSTKRAQDRMETMKVEFEDLQKRYESQKGVLKPAAREDLEKQIIEKQMALRQELQRTQMDLQSRDAELTGAILDELRPFIEDIAKQRKVELVIEKGESGVLWADPKLDLTQVVLQRYDASKKTGGK